MVINPIALIVGLIVFVCLFWVVRWAMGEMGVPPTIAKVINVLLVLIFVLWLLSSLGVLGGFGTVRVG
jgi:hypothetical protein